MHRFRIYFLAYLNVGHCVYLTSLEGKLSRLYVYVLKMEVFFNLLNWECESESKINSDENCFWFIRFLDRYLRNFTQLTLKEGQFYTKECLDLLQSTCETCAFRNAFIVEFCIIQFIYLSITSFLNIQLQKTFT